jgi:nicotinamidase-related amidase
MKTALLVIDVQNALVDQKPYQIDEVLANIQTLITECRQKSIEVIFVQHSEPGSEFHPNTEGWQLHSKVTPLTHEKRIEKFFNSAFKGTDLKVYLKQKGIQQLIITGMQTEYCVDATAKVAFEFGYHLIFPTMTNTSFHSGNIPAKDLHEHYNTSVFPNFGIIENIEETIKRVQQ